MDPSIVFLLAALLTLLFLLYQKQTKPNKLRAPGPRGLPFIGNLLQFQPKDTHKYLWSLAKKYGPIMSMKLGYRPVLVISSSKLIQEILKSHDLAFSSRPILKGLYKLSYNGMDVGFSPYNNSWREMRKISTVHLFSHKQVQSFCLIREDETFQMIKRLLKETSDSPKAVINISEIASAFTNNLICRTAFGKNYGEDGYEKRRFYNLLGETQAVLVAFYFSDYLPSLGWIDKVSGIDARLEKVFKELDCFYDELIEEHLREDRPASMRGDILDLLIELKIDKSTPIDVTWDHIKGLIMNVFSGGTDTSAAAIVWAMTALIKHPPILKRVQEEIRSFAISKETIDEEDIENLPYLQAIIKETFRLFPSTPLLALRETIEKCTVSGYEVESGTMVYINAWGIARDPEVWENAEEFIPERFLGSDIDVKGHHPEVIPFGIGRRRCPGIPMAMASVGLGVVNLLYAFNWELPSGVNEDDIDYEVLPGVTMHKKNALWLVAKPMEGFKSN